MSKVMMTIRAERAPTLDAIRTKYGLGEDDLDEAFGVIAVDPEAHAYTVLVEGDKTNRIRTDDEWIVEGPYSNPRIEPFGPE